MRFLNVLLLLLSRVLIGVWRREGRDEVLKEQEVANANASKKAAEIDLDAATSDLTDLSERMHNYERDA